MFSLGRQTDYAARIVLHLSSLPPGERVTAQQIAQKRLIPPAFIKRIVSRLSSAGIIETVRGSGGGLALSRPPSQISLLEVVEAFEGPLSLNVCVQSAGDCPLSEHCPVQKSWVGATRHLAEHLKRVRFDVLAGGLSEAGPAGGVVQIDGKLVEIKRGLRHGR